MKSYLLASALLLLQLNWFLGWEEELHQPWKRRKRERKARQRMALWTRGGLGSFMAEREEARESMHGVGERLWNGDCQREMMKRLEFREI